MFALENKEVLVIGLGGRGRAACELLCRQGAKVVVVDSGDNPDLRENAEKLRPLGVEVFLGASSCPRGNFSLAVLSPTVPPMAPLVQTVVRSRLPLISELELGYQQAKCLAIAVGGTNGKGTTSEMIERILLSNHRKAIVSGHRARPVCAVVDQTKDLDFLILQVNAFQLERTEFFRPAVSVLLNLAPDHLDRFATAEEYVRTNARLFCNQQSFDWAIRSE